MKRFLRMAVVSAMLFALLPLQARAAELLIPVGKIIGLHLRSGGVTVVAYDDALGDRARKAGLRIGDEIVAVSGTAVATPEQVRSALSNGTVSLTIRREVPVIL